MGKRQKSWARRSKLSLVSLMGAKCVKCGSTEQLEFDCVSPMGGSHHRWDTSARMSFYRRQYATGNLQLLCRTCHSAKSVHEFGHETGVGPIHGRGNAVFDVRPPWDSH